MQGLVERARQALGVGPDAFLASTLEAQELTMKELDVFAPNLRDMVKAAQTFAGDTDKFLMSSAHYVTEAPLPQLWMQGSATEPAQVTQLPVPTEHAAWFDASVAEREAGIVPGAVGYSLQRELIAPMEQWLWAHQVAQGRLSELQSGRLGYDAERRKLVQRATAATSSHSEHAGTSLDPALAQLTEEAAAINATLSEYESDMEALDDLLHWLVEGAVRLKALLADVSGAVGASADSWTIPPGIMPPFPEKSSFGQDLEVTVTLSDSPLGAKTEEVVATSTTSSPNDESTRVTSFRPRSQSHTAAAHSGGEESGGDKAQPDLSALLPSDDAMVYGGGVAPPSSGAQPSGGGVGQLLKDTLMPPTDDTSSSRDSSSSSSKAAAEGGGSSEGIIPHLSGVLPSEGDDITVEKGSQAELAPLPGSQHARPSGGGIGQFLKESITGFVTPNEGEDSRSSEAPSQPEDSPSEAAAAPANLQWLVSLPGGSQHAQPSGGGVGQLLKESVTGVATPNEGEDSKQLEGQPEGGKGEGEAAASPPDLSALLPSDDAMVYGGGVAPAQDTGRAAPPGGGVWQMVKDTIMPSGGKSDESSGTTDESTTLPAAPEIASRSAHTYSGEGTGRVEARTSDAAAAGLGAGQRRLGRAWSADTPAASATAQDQDEEVSAEGKELAIVPAAPADSVTDGTATAAASTTASANTATGDADDADVPITDSTAPPTADSTSSSSIGAAAAAAVGGVWGRLKHSVAEAGSAAAAAVADARSTAAAAASAVASAVPGVGAGSDEVTTEVADVVGEELTGAAGEGDVEAVVAAFHDAQGGDTGPIDTTAPAAAAADSGRDTPDVSAWVSNEAGTTPPVGLTEPAPAGPAPDQPEMLAAMPTAAYPSMAGPAPTAENIKQTTRRVRESLSQYSEATGGSAEAGAEAPPHMGPVALPESVVGDPTATDDTSTAAHEPGEMHIGPVTPSDGPKDAAPGSANWVKGATQPGGAAACGEGEAAAAAAGKDSADVSQGQMHIGPEQPDGGPTTPAPGSAIWVKEATRPGGAAAAAPAGSDDTDAVLDTDSKKEPTAKPQGGGIGAFIKDTLLGPSK